VLDDVAREHEIVLVNDGSDDASWAIIEELARDDAHVVGLDLARNYGQHNALLAGIRQARMQTIVTLDDDLQHPPEEIPRLLDQLTKGHDVVYGTTTQRAHSVLRRLGSQATKRALQQFMSAETARDVSAFRAFDTSVRDAFAGYQGATVSIDVLLTWGTDRFTSVPVAHEPRRIGRSGYSTWKLINLALDMVVGFSSRPLRIASTLGFAFTIFGIGVLVYVAINYALVGGEVPGFTFIAATVAIFSGIQLFSLGILGEYLARVHLRVMEQPPYVVRTRLSGRADGSS
jgi:undecaprenyl-phosphate 4-deoxy-4-formamido-L-arabinose transferase